MTTAPLNPAAIREDALRETAEDRRIAALMMQDHNRQGLEDRANTTERLLALADRLAADLVAMTADRDMYRAALQERFYRALLCIDSADSSIGRDEPLDPAAIKADHARVEGEPFCTSDEHEGAFVYWPCRTHRLAAELAAALDSTSRTSSRSYNWGCQCEPCRKAGSDDYRRRRRYLKRKAV